MKVLENLRDGCQILKGLNISSYEIDCENLMSQTLNVSREELLLNLEKEVSNKEKEKYFNLIKRRKKNEPIAYLINNKNFWKEKFIVDKNVLIPRPDSEHLVEQALRIIKKDQSKRILDIGVGSGCLAISIPFPSLYIVITPVFLLIVISIFFTGITFLSPFLIFSFKRI